MKGYRLFSRRPGNVYPPVARARSSAKNASAAASAIQDHSNTNDVSHKCGLSPPTFWDRNSLSSNRIRKNAVVLLDNTGKVLQNYASQAEAGAALGLSAPQVSNAVRVGHIPKVSCRWIMFSRKFKSAIVFNASSVRIFRQLFRLYQLGTNRLRAQLQPGSVYPTAGAERAGRIPHIMKVLSSSFFFCVVAAFVSNVHAKRTCQVIHPQMYHW